MKLLPQLVNLSNIKTTTTTKIYELAEATDTTSIVLIETIIAWLSSVDDLAQAGKPLQTRDIDQQTMPYILGAITALLDPNMVEGLGITRQTAKTLLNTIFTNNKYSEKVKNKLIQLGQHQAFGQTKQVKQTLDSGNQQLITQMITTLTRTAKKQLLFPDTSLQQNQQGNVERSWFTDQSQSAQNEETQPIIPISLKLLTSIVDQT